MKKKPIDKYIELFSDLTIDKVKEFDHIVYLNIEFTDPFNVVKGLDSFKNIFNHMFKNIKDPKFKIIDYSIEKKKNFFEMGNDFFCI